jgi:hypothetical protein
MVTMYRARSARFWFRLVPLVAATVAVSVTALTSTAHAAVGAPAVALAAATAPTPKNDNLFRLPVIALVIVTGLLALVSVRRVVRGG